MATTTALYARIDTNLKQNAENILNQLGISPASAIGRTRTGTSVNPLDFESSASANSATSA